MFRIPIIHDLGHFGGGISVVIRDYNLKWMEECGWEEQVGTGIVEDSWNVIFVYSECCHLVIIYGLETHIPLRIQRY